MFSREFAMRWCTVTEDQARDAIEELTRFGLMVRQSKHKRAWQWLPGFGKTEQEGTWPDLVPEKDDFLGLEKDDFLRELKEAERRNQDDAPF